MHCRSNNAIGANVGEEVVNSWVSLTVVAAAIAEEITINIVGGKLRFVASEEINYNDFVKALKESIGKPDLKWQTLTDEQMECNLVSISIKPAIARGITEMYSA